MAQWFHTTVEVQPVQDGVEVREVQAAGFHVGGLLLDGRGIETYQKTAQVLVYLGPQGPGCCLCLVRGKFHRHDHVRLDLYDRALGFFGHVLPPFPLRTHIAPVGDEQGSVPGGF